MINVGNDWQPLFDAEQVKPYYLELRAFLKHEYMTKIVYPPMNEIFNAFRLTPFNDVKVIIVGQDPYHEEGQAMGLSFSVHENVDEPPSLKNIHQEIIAEGVEQGPWSRDLTRWAKQGVLLLNSTLTVVQHRAASHAGKGWEQFTDNAIEALGKDERPKVFMLWGNYARSKKSLIACPNHLILESAHPSPLSVNKGFFGNGHFRACNNFLKATGQEIVIW
ncbi:MAG: uracil-DNA glycosylase [Spirochaetes bacterium]|uniref:Uracil-DNA glycosylase n=1 Tax=Candidatus Ornithospirochaeta stercoripullorum TaxID=2840899 RepID=A0A9D9E040_9SPIO|nr:uracil-DNA glycosylase [Candidatus Ornithospirochaeta stercoripullorum]